MKSAVLDRLPGLLFNDLEPDETEQMAKLLAESPELARELSLVHESMALRAAVLRPTEPSPRARERLLATLFGTERFRAFLEPLRKMVDLPEDVVRNLLAKIDEPTAWEAGPLPGLSLIHFAHGPRAVAHESGLVRIAAGQMAPRHRHLGAETNIVLEGTLWEEGICHFPGEILEFPPESVHDFRAGTERDLVFVVSHAGIEFL